MTTPSLKLHVLLCAGLMGCSAASSARHTSQGQSEATPTSAPVSETEPAESGASERPDNVLDEYFEFAEAINVTETPGTREYLQRCRGTLGRDEDDDAFTECASVVARNRDGEFVAIDIGADFRGRPEHIRVNVYREGEEHELLSAAFSAQSLNQLADLARRGGWGTMDNLLSHAYRDTFSLVSVTPFVRLSGMPTDSGLWVQQGDDLDHPTYSLLAVNDDGTRRLLGTRAGTLGTSGDWVCGERMCTHEELRAMDRLCVLPLNILRASHRDGILVLQGYVAKTGHRDFPAFHWFVPYPDL